MENNNRGSFSGSLGFILTAVGSAVGLGNLWGFPYKMGANGGFPFLIIYLVFVVFCGVVFMGIEMSIGRKTGKSPVLAMGELGKQYKFIGWFSVLCPIIISGFYSILIGYSVRYVWGFLLEIFGANGFGGMGGEITGKGFHRFCGMDLPAPLLFVQKEGDSAALVRGGIL